MADDGGLSRLQKRLAAIPAQVKENAAAANMKSAEEMADLMRDLVPVESGELRDSIQTHGPGEKFNDKVSGEKGTVSETGAAVTAGDDKAFYARMLEFGTVHAPAYPYFMPVVRSLKARAMRRMRRAISAGIKASKSNG